MSGNFDFPPASRPSTVAGRESPSLLRQRLREFNTIRAQMEESTRPTYEAAPMSLEEYASFPGSRRHHNSRLRRRGVAFPNHTDASTSTLMEQLDNATTVADSLLDQPLQSYPRRSGSPDVNRRESPSEAEINRRRKRRKIDHADRSLYLGNLGFRYGHKGSVVPGPLQMEIESCDGGIISQLSMHGQLYAPENVLRNDQRVYCTHQNRCNLILKHKGGATFSLTKLVIKSPESGFTAPVQEGFVFVSMAAEGLMTGAANYSMQFSNLHQRTMPPNVMDENHRPLSRRRDSAVRNVPPPISNTYPRYSDRNTTATQTQAEDEEAVNDVARNVYPRDVVNPAVLNIVQNRRGDFDVQTNCEDSSSEKEEPSSPGTLADRYRRNIEPPSYDVDTSDENDGEIREADPINDSLAAQARVMREARNMRGRRVAEPSRLEAYASALQSSRHDSDKTAPSEEQQVAAHTSGVLLPHARFFIAKDKNVVSIKFKPAVAGKYILLKLWSPSRNNNIDIQSVIPYGFAGPRYFPAEEML